MTYYADLKVVDAARTFVSRRGVAGSSNEQYDALCKAVSIAPTPERIRLPMACGCGVEEERATRRAELDAVIESLGIDPSCSDLGTRLLWYLHWKCGGFNVESVGVDMWMGVEVQSKTHRLYVECDRFEDGLAAIARYIVDSGLAVDWDGGPDETSADDPLLPPG